MIDKVRLYAGWLAGILAAGLFLTDCFGGHREHVAGTVTDRIYHADYWSVDCSTDDKGKTTCTTNYHPAEYWLRVRSWEGLESVRTSEAKYYTIHEGQALTYSRIRTKWSKYTWGNSY
jgi:hypothetical protein